LGSEIDYLGFMKQKDLELFAHWAREAGRSGLVKCSSGNLSQRLDDGTMLISASGSWLSTLETNEIAQISISDDLVLNTVKPSAEYRFHREIMRNRPEVKTVLHFQSLSATTIACMDLIPDYNIIIEVPIYIGKVGFVPFLPPGSVELAEAIGEQILNSNLLQLSNHGQVVCGNDYRDVFQKAIFFELACSVLLQSNFKTRPITGDQIDRLREYNRNK
jgi:ribulose-5-phosphate 4-epimerase/fuculose-1-phosphate aldolase